MRVAQGVNVTTEEIASRLGNIEATLVLIKERLLGNGQPGEIDKHNTRLTALESVSNFNRGALWVIGAILTLAVSGGLLHVFKVGLR